METFEDYIKQRFKLIRKYLHDFSETKDKESLHKFRVEFKKINAAAHLTGICTRDFDSGKELKKFRKLIKLSGKIRDADIRLELLTQLNITITGKHKELRNRKENSRKFCALQLQYKHAFKSLKKKLLRHSEDINAGGISEYIAKIKRDISGNYSLQDTVTALHHIRKEVKALKYISEIQASVLSKELLVSCNELQELLGKWRDNLLLAEYLKKKQPAMKTVIRRLELKNRNYLSDIEASLRNSGLI